MGVSGANAGDYGFLVAGLLIAGSTIVGRRGPKTASTH
jgi:hypothetical protein